jgi:hypothetical protein
MLAFVRRKAAAEFNLHGRVVVAEIRPGCYRHYKGNDYTVFGVARHSETLEEFVVYRQEYGDCGLWIRPAAMFSETVISDGESVARFRYLGNDDQ